MEFNIPSFANDYSFIVCYKEKPTDKVWEYYSVMNTMNEAQDDIKYLRRKKYDFLLIINVSHYEKALNH